MRLDEADCVASLAGGDAAPSGYAGAQGGGGGMGLYLGGVGRNGGGAASAGNGEFPGLC
jgi:hypothetical protein